MNILISSNSNGGGDSTNVLQHRQISSTTRPNTIMRTPDHYEMIDQIGKGEKIFLIASLGTIFICSLFLGSFNWAWSETYILKGSSVEFYVFIPGS